MLTAILLAVSQPTTLDALNAPAPGSFGWIEGLAGSCFTGEDGRAGFRRSECFAMREGRFTISSVSSTPTSAAREECVLESAGDMTLRFACSRQGGPTQVMIGRYEQGALVTRRLSQRRAAISPHERIRTIWIRTGTDQLSIRIEMPDRDSGGWTTFPLSPPVLLTRQ